MPQQGTPLTPAQTSGLHDNAPPIGSPPWITAELIRLTRIVWEPLYKAQLSVAEAVTLLTSAGRLSDVLARG